MSKQGREYRKSQEQERATLSRRRFLFGAAAVGGLAALTTAFWKPTVTFEEAKQKPELRQKYAEQLYSQYKDLPYLESIVYSHTVKRNSAGPFLMEITNYEVGDLGKRKKSSVVIYQSGFDNKFVLTENDFLSALIDHEFEGHAKLFFLGSPEITEDDFRVKSPTTEYNITIMQDVLELYAYINQINNRKQRNISAEFEQDTLDRIWRLYSDLIHPDRDNSIADSRALERFRKRFFISEFQHMAVSINGYNGPVLLPNNQMLTFFGPVDLPVYLRK